VYKRQMTMTGSSFMSMIVPHRCDERVMPV